MQKQSIQVAMRRSIIQLFGIALLATSLIGMQTAVHAQTLAPSFSLQPVTYNPAAPQTKSYFLLAMQAGTTLQDEVRVTNVGTAVGSVSVYPVTATTSQNTGVAYLSKTATLKDVAAWITLQAQQFALAPGQSQVVPFQVIVPGSAKAGFHLGGIVAENLLPTSTANSGALHINVVGRTIIPVEVNLPGSSVEQISVTEAQAGGLDGYQTIILSMANTGNTILTPTGVLKVTNMQGQLLQNLPLAMNTFLPNTTIHYPIAIQKKALGPGNYQTTVDLSYGHHHTLHYVTTFTITQTQVTQAFSNTPLQTPVSATSQNSMPLWSIILITLVAAIVLLIGGQKLSGLVSARRRK